MAEERNKYPGPQAPAGDGQHARARPQPGTRSGGPQGDARNDREEIKRNQERLGVDPDHRTPEMKKHRRGTFP